MLRSVTAPPLTGLLLLPSLASRLLMDAPADRLFAIWHACGLVRVLVCLIFLRQPAASALALALPYPTLPYPILCYPTVRSPPLPSPPSLKPFLAYPSACPAPPVRPFHPFPSTLPSLPLPFPSFCPTRDTLIYSSVQLPELLDRPCFVGPDLYLRTAQRHSTGTVPVCTWPGTRIAVKAQVPAGAGAVA